ncbi:TPA: hypothetical protein QCY49_000249 [Bacillus paranthracis]|nr:hypothetical protein [Bacillus paranthracis]
MIVIQFKSDVKVRCVGLLSGIGWVVLGQWTWQLVKWMTPGFLLGIGTGWLIWG